MSYSKEPWKLVVDESQKKSKFSHCIYSGNKVVVGGRYASDYDHISLDDMRRAAACVNACRGIPTHVLENWQGTDTEGFKPEDWLLNTVTEDGSGYVLASPAGGVMRLTSEQRERIGKALLALASKQPDAKA